MDYLHWNELIGERFFNEAMAGREVLLYVNEDIINLLGKDNGADINDFIESIKEGPGWVSGRGICQKAIRACEFWKRNKRGLAGYPPFLAYLAVFVLAATIGEDGLNPNAYFKRLYRLMKEPEKSGTYPSFYETDNLWTQLEIWSKTDKHETLGRFTRRIRGGHAHVGLPLSQILLSDNERKKLPLLFWEAELDPANIPTENAIRHAILNFGTGKLHGRTLKLLREKKSNSNVLADALIDLIFEELAEWDGSLPQMTPGKDTGARTSVLQAFVALKICMEIDYVAGAAKSWLRFKTNNPFPESDIEFENQGKIYLTRSYKNGWSAKLQNLDASTLDWLSGVQFQDKDRGWKAKLKSADARIFLPGIYEGFSGWIESDHLERNCKFLLACHTSKLQIAQAWGNLSCRKFENLNIQGIPHDWQLFKVEDAKESCSGIDVLTLPENLFLRLKDGIRVGRTNDYLSLKPPQIILSGGQGNERITVNGHEIPQKDTSYPSWHLPKDAKIDEPLNIEVYRGEDGPIISPKTIYLIEPKLSDTLCEAPKRDRSGSVTHNNALPYARGAIIEGFASEAWRSIPQVLPINLSKRITFLGSRPGEIVDWPKEALPDNWHPIWALYKIKRDRFGAYFCGNSAITGGSCNPQSYSEDSRAVKRWIWAIRKKTVVKVEPRLKIVSRLWAEYKRAAKHA